MSHTAKVWTTTGSGIAVLLLAAVFFFGMRHAPEAPPQQGEQAVHTTQVRVERPATVPAVFSWKHFTTKDGLPSDKVLSVKVDGKRVWLGTNAGLVLYENGTFRTYTTKDGLVHNAVVHLALDPRTGDLWIGTAGGLSRFSGGKFENFTQLSSGLLNDMIYAVAVDGDDVWAASAAGASRYNTRTKQWQIWNETNTPMHEPWTYAIGADGGDLVYVGAWGSGVLEFNKKTGHWKDYMDPDGELELDVMKNDGPVHDITSFLDYEDGIVWQVTYFGASTFDGRTWKDYFMEDSGLIGNFCNVVNANGKVGWIGTDRGLSTFDFQTKTWRSYRRTPSGSGEIIVTDEYAKKKKVIPTATGPVHNYVLGIDFQGDKIWIGTEGGVSVGTPERAIAGL